MISSTDLGLRPGIKGKRVLKVISLKERSMAEAGLSGKMVHIIKENLLMEFSKAEELTILQTVIKLMRASLEWAIWRAKESNNGKMAENTKVILKMGRKKAKAQWNGQTEQNTLDHGEMT